MKPEHIACIFLALLIVWVLVNYYVQAVIVGIMDFAILLMSCAFVIAIIHALSKQK